MQVSLMVECHKVELNCLYLPSDQKKVCANGRVSGHRGSMRKESL